MKSHRKDWCWSWNSNILATWCEELTHWKRPWCWERLRAGEGDDRGWDGWMEITDWIDMNLSKLQELVMERETWHTVVHGVAKCRTWLSDWTELNIAFPIQYCISGIRPSFRSCPLERKIANHFSILASRNSWTSWKGKKLWYQEIIPEGDTWATHVSRCLICYWGRAQK